MNTHKGGLGWVALVTALGMQAGVARAQEPVGSQFDTSGYDGGFYLRSADGDNEVRLGLRLQARYEHLFQEGPADNEAAFSIPRARLSLKGHLFGDRLTYKFQSDFGKGNVALKDFYGDYAFVPEQLHLRVGQWKRPFSRQQMTSSGKLAFVDRAITDKAFGAGRDIGLAVHNNYSKSPQVEWALGVYNGTGDKGALSGDVQVDPMTGEGTIDSGGFSNVPDKPEPALVGRVGYNFGGNKGYDEVDFEGGDLRCSVGASALAAFDADQDDDSRVLGEVDYDLKVGHFATQGGVYLASTQSGTGFSDRDLARIGYHAQAGYLLAGRFLPAVRFAHLLPDGDENDVLALTAGLSVFIYEHDLKWQTDGSLIRSEAPGDALTDYRLRTQLQLQF